ncbi:hypothetical protein HQ447_18660 [bacterium]|nr:hypothetical protein [bacterium]
MSRLPLIALLLTSPAIAHSFAIPKGMSAVERTRFERFESFQIKGVCGEGDLKRLAKLGVNTLRGYTLGKPEIMRKKLDEAHRLGIKMILSEWMPHHGPNKNQDGILWNFDYHTQGDKMVANLIRKVEAIGDHPAILMWGLGNEVHLDEPYLRVVNRLSREIHQRFPLHLTSLTMVNAKPEAIAAVKKFAPDLDVLGIQSYSRGAVRGAIKKTEQLWGRPFYMSEFNSNGPWNFQKTEWEVPLDEPAINKVRDLKDCYAAIDASPLCLGSTVFVWGHYAVDDRPTYFSMLLDPHPAGRKALKSFDHQLMTPQADAMAEHFTGKPIQGNRAPVLSKLEFEGGAKSRQVRPGDAMTLSVAAEDSNGDKVDFVTWILKSKVRKTTAVTGPVARPAGGKVVVDAPKTPGDYLVMVYAMDNKGGASAGVLPFKVAHPAAASGRPVAEP